MSFAPRSGLGRLRQAGLHSGRCVERESSKGPVDGHVLGGEAHGLDRTKLGAVWDEWDRTRSGSE